MSGLLSSLVGAATAALSLRSTGDSAPRVRTGPEGAENGFASLLSAALSPRQRTAEAEEPEAVVTEGEEAPAAAESSNSVEPGAGPSEAADGPPIGDRRIPGSLRSSSADGAPIVSDLGPGRSVHANASPGGLPVGDRAAAGRANAVPSAGELPVGGQRAAGLGEAIPAPSGRLVGGHGTAGSTEAAPSSDELPVGYEVAASGNGSSSGGGLRLGRDLAAVSAEAISSVSGPSLGHESAEPTDGTASAGAPLTSAAEEMAGSLAASGATANAATTAATTAPASTGVTPAKAADSRAPAAASATAAAEAATEKSTGPRPAIANPSRVSRAMDELNVEFRARLDRVIERMESEYGHEVTVVETFRDQARQEHLFAQGRTRPGPVVTWTRNSNHTQGRAADLLVDGTYDNPLAMVRLARIAREEGLRTLGAKDPGHVELPRGARVESLTVGADASASLLDSGARGTESLRAAAAVQTRRVAHSGEIAQPARVAQVGGIAQVAQVARVARVGGVARVATPGSVGGGTMELPSAPPAAPSVVPEHAPAAPAGQLADSTADSSSDEKGRRESGSLASEVVQETFGEPAQRVAPATSFGFEARGAGAGPTVGDVRGVPGAFGAEAAERIARVLQLRDDAPARPLTQMVLRLDNASGGEDRIRVDLRGTSVGAALSMGDPVAAARMQSELGQLQRALEGKGLQAEHLSVTGSLAGRELAEALRMTLPTESGQRASQDSDSQRESWKERPGSRSGDAESENPRQRPRKDSQHGSNT